jgi:pimeloyl-ACP methyl ester carboxylesterase
MMTERVQCNTRDLPAIVFIHGDFADGLESWGPVVAGLGTRFRSVVIDRPGFNQEFAPETRFTIADDARYVLAALDELALTSFHLVGHSYGGLVAIETAVTQPAAVRSLHLVEPPLLDLLPDDPVVRDLDERARAVQLAHQADDEEETARAFFVTIGASHTVERLSGTPEWDRIAAHAPRFAASEPAGVYPRARLDRLDTRLPVTLYSGGRSHPALRAVAAALAARIDGARFVAVANAGHAVQMAGAAFRDPLLQFVAEADAAWPRRAQVSGANRGG